MFGLGRKKEETNYRGDGSLIPFKSFEGVGTGSKETAQDILADLARAEAELEEERVGDKKRREESEISRKLNKNFLGGEVVNQLVAEHGWGAVEKHFAQSPVVNEKVVAARMEVTRKLYKQIPEGRRYIELDIEEERRGEGGKFRVEEVLRRIPASAKKVIIDALPFESE